MVQSSDRPTIFINHIIPISNTFISFYDELERTLLNTRQEPHMFSLLPTFIEYCLQETAGLASHSWCVGLPTQFCSDLCPHRTGQPIGSVIFLLSELFRSVQFVQIIQFLCEVNFLNFFRLITELLFFSKVKHQFYVVFFILF